MSAHEVSYGTKFKNGSSKICGGKPLKNLEWYSLLKMITPLRVAS